MQKWSLSMDVNTIFNWNRNFSHIHNSNSIMNISLNFPNHSIRTFRHIWVQACFKRSLFADTFLLIATSALLHYLPHHLGSITETCTGTALVPSENLYLPFTETDVAVCTSNIRCLLLSVIKAAEAQRVLASC